MEPPTPDHYPQPEGNDPGSLSGALEALRAAHDEPSAGEAYDRFLWAVGNNHTGTFYPVVLAALPHIEQILIGGGTWPRHAAMESLIDLGGSFVPEPGHETHLGVSIQGTLRAFIRSMRPHVVPLAHGSDELSRGAADLVELIDDLADLPQQTGGAGGMDDRLRITLESPDQPEVIALIDELDAHQKPLYPPESHHGIDIRALSQENVLFAVARSATGEAVACGAIVVQPEYGELKRMFTKPALRGRGVARALLAFLESEAQARGCNRFMLETGPLQPEALALYERCGYERRGPFGAYTDDPHSVFMAKSVA